MLASNLKSEGAIAPLPPAVPRSMLGSPTPSQKHTIANCSQTGSPVLPPSEYKRAIPPSARLLCSLLLLWKSCDDPVVREWWRIRIVGCGMVRTQLGCVSRMEAAAAAAGAAGARARTWLDTWLDRSPPDERSPIIPTTARRPHTSISKCDNSDDYLFSAGRLLRDVMRHVTRSRASNAEEPW